MGKKRIFIVCKKILYIKSINLQKHPQPALYISVEFINHSYSVFCIVIRTCAVLSSVCCNLLQETFFLIEHKLQLVRKRLL